MVRRFAPRQSAVNINIAETVNVQAEGPAKDGTLSCAAVGPRMDDASQAIVVDVLDLPRPSSRWWPADNRSRSTALGTSVMRSDGLPWCETSAHVEERLRWRSPMETTAMLQTQ